MAYPWNQHTVLPPGLDHSVYAPLGNPLIPPVLQPSHHAVRPIFSQYSPPNPAIFQSSPPRLPPQPYFGMSMVGVPNRLGPPPAPVMGINPMLHRFQPPSQQSGYATPASSTQTTHHHSTLVRYDPNIINASPAPERTVASYQETLAQRNEIYRKFAVALAEHGALEPTDQQILSIFVGLTTFERKLVMADGNIREFLSRCSYIEVSNNKLQLIEEYIDDSVLDEDEKENNLWISNEEDLDKSKTLKHKDTSGQPIVPLKPQDFTKEIDSGGSGDHVHDLEIFQFKASQSGITLWDPRERLKSTEVEGKDDHDCDAVRTELRGGQKEELCSPWLTEDNTQNEIIDYIQDEIREETLANNEIRYESFTEEFEEKSIAENDIREDNLTEEDTEGESLTEDEIGERDPLEDVGGEILEGNITEDETKEWEQSESEVEYSCDEHKSEERNECAEEVKHLLEETNENDKVEGNKLGKFVRLDDTIFDLKMLSPEQEPILSAARSVVTLVLENVWKKAQAREFVVKRGDKKKVKTSSSNSIAESSCSLSVDVAVFVPRNRWSTVDESLELNQDMTTWSTADGSVVQNKEFDNWSTADRSIMQNKETNMESNAEVFMEKYIQSTDERPSENREWNVTKDIPESTPAIPSLMSLDVSLPVPSREQACSNSVQLLRADSPEFKPSHTPPCAPHYQSCHPVHPRYSPTRPIVQGTRFPTFQPRSIPPRVSTLMKIAPKLHSTTQTDTPQFRDASTSARRYKSASASVETDSCSTRDVYINTVDSMFSQDSEYCPVMCCDQAVMTEIQTKSKKVQIGGGIRVADSETQTDRVLCGTVEQVDSLEYDEVVSRAIQAEEQVLQLQTQMCLSELTRVMYDVDTRFNQSLSEAEKRELEASHFEVIAHIKEEMNKLETLYQDNLEALQSGIVLGDLPSITFSYPQIPQELLASHHKVSHDFSGMGSLCPMYVKGQFVAPGTGVDPLEIIKDMQGTATPETDFENETDSNHNQVYNDALDCSSMASSCSETLGTMTPPIGSLSAGSTPASLSAAAAAISEFKKKKKDKKKKKKKKKNSECADDEMEGKVSQKEALDSMMSTMSETSLADSNSCKDDENLLRDITPVSSEPVLENTNVMSVNQTSDISSAEQLIGGSSEGQTTGGSSESQATGGSIEDQATNGMSAPQEFDIGALMQQVMMMLIQNNPALAMPASLNYLQFMALQHIQNMQALCLIKLSPEQTIIFEELMTRAQASTQTASTDMQQQASLQMELMKQTLTGSQPINTMQTVPVIPGTLSHPVIPGSQYLPNSQQTSVPKSHETDVSLSTREPSYLSENNRNIQSSTTAMSGPPPGLETNVTHKFAEKLPSKKLPPGLNTQINNTNLSQKIKKSETLSSMKSLSSSSNSLSSDKSVTSMPDIARPVSLRAGRGRGRGIRACKAVSVMDDVDDGPDVASPGLSSRNCSTPSSVSGQGSSHGARERAQFGTPDCWEDIDSPLPPPGVRTKLAAGSTREMTSAPPTLEMISTSGATSSQLKQVSSSGLMTSEPSQPRKAVISSSGLMTSEPNQPRKAVISSSGLQTSEPSQPRKAVISSSGLQTSEPNQPRKAVISSSGLQTSEPNQPRKAVISSSGLQTSEPNLPRKAVISSSGLQTSEPNQPRKAVISSLGLQTSEPNQPRKAVISSSGLQTSEPNQPRKAVISSLGLQQAGSSQPKKAVIGSGGTHSVMSNKPKKAVISSGGLQSIGQQPKPKRGVIGSRGLSEIGGATDGQSSLSKAEWPGLGQESEDWDEDQDESYHMYKWESWTGTGLQPIRLPEQVKTSDLDDFEMSKQTLGAKIWTNKPMSVIGGSVSVKQPSRLKAVQAEKTNPLLTGTTTLQPKMLSAGTHRYQPSVVTAKPMKGSGAMSKISDINLHEDPRTVTVPETEDWKQVGKKKSKKADPAHGGKPDSNFEKLVGKLQTKHPSLSRQEILNNLQEVRNQHGGLKGMKMQDIVNQVESFVCRSGSMGAKETKANIKVQGASVSSRAGLDIEKLLYKTSICTYWQAGSCSRGNSCDYAHSKSELRPPPKYILCANYMNGKCNHGSKCLFAHGKKELQPPPQGGKVRLSFAKPPPLQIDAAGTSEFPALGGVSVKPQGAATWGATGTNPPQNDFTPSWLRSGGGIIDDDDDPDAETCVICVDAIRPGQQIQQLECGHEFHEPCIKRWIFGEESTCPTCRKHVLLAEEYPALGR